MKTKTYLLLSLLVTLGILLVSCKGNNANIATTGSNTATTSGSASTSLSEVNLLLVGTLKLEGTEQAVTANEATQLLPL